MAASLPRVCIVLVNWNAWPDTVECLESLLRSDYPDFQVIVCDNASTDGSVDKLMAWSRGEHVWAGPESPDMARFSMPPLPKPVNLLVIDAPATPDESSRAADVVIIRTGRNLGFAGGNNVGMRFALAQPDVAFIWLLNNDTVVEPEALRQLAARVDGLPDAGPCGATIRFYHNPDIVQARSGSRYNKWTAQSQCIGGGSAADAAMDPALVERQIDFVTGASMFLSRAFLQTVGLMEEKYFLYFEEIDWAVRAGKAFPPLYAPEATVYHKEGGSIGSSSQKGGRSRDSEFYLTRSKVLFTRTFFPRLLPSIYASSLVQIARRALRGHWNRAGAILRALMGEGAP